MYTGNYKSLLKIALISLLLSTDASAGIIWSEGYTGHEWQNHSRNDLRAVGSTIPMERGKAYAVWWYQTGITLLPISHSHNNLNGNIFVRKHSDVSVKNSQVTSRIGIGNRRLRIPGIGLKVSLKTDLRINSTHNVMVGFPARSVGFRVNVKCGPFEDHIKVPLRSATITRKSLKAGQEATLKVEAKYKMECKPKRLLIVAPACFDIFRPNGQSISNVYLNWGLDDPARLNFKVKARPACRGKVNYKQNIAIHFGGETKNVEVIWSQPLTTPSNHRKKSPTIRRF